MVALVTQALQALFVAEVFLVVRGFNIGAGDGVNDFSEVVGRAAVQTDADLVGGGDALDLECIGKTLGRSLFAFMWQTPDAYGHFADGIDEDVRASDAVHLLVNEGVVLLGVVRLLIGIEGAGVSGGDVDQRLGEVAFAIAHMEIEKAGCGGEKKDEESKQRMPLETFQ